MFAVATGSASARVFARLIADPGAMPAKPNAFSLLFDPRLVRPFVVDWEKVARGLTARLHRDRPTAVGGPAP